MTYRERRAAKADRLREWADKRDVKATATRAATDQLADSRPFGQPILVGHHSEKRARRDQDRIYSGMRRSIDDADKAAEFRRRADGIEAAADHAIYSDDTDAGERLVERIAEREAERDRIKAFNANVRKTGSHDLALLDDRQKASYLSIVNHAPYQLGKGGTFPGYELSNLGATIRKDKKRLAAMSTDLTTVAQPDTL